MARNGRFSRRILADATKYKFNEPRFQQIVVAGLKKLPPAKAMNEVPLRTAALDQGASQTGSATGAANETKPGTPSRPLTALEKAMLLAKCNCHPAGDHQAMLPQAIDPR